MDYNISMTFDDYQNQAKTTAIHPKGTEYFYPVLGLCSEVGEVASKVKKAFRDDAGEFSDSRKADLEKELGDVLWYLSQICTDFGLSLDRVANKNLEKLLSRKERGVLSGDGDNR